MKPSRVHIGNQAAHPSDDQLSALLDGELSGLELEAAIDRLLTDTGAHRQWHRYHQIGRLMRGEQPQTLPDDILANISNAIAREPAIIAAPKRRPYTTFARHARQTAGLALAASVATAAVLLLLPGEMANDPALSQPTPHAASPSASPVTVASQPVGSPLHWNRTEPALESRLNSYVVNHNEYAASSGIQGVLPYMRIVGFAPNEVGRE